MVGSGLEAVFVQLVAVFQRKSYCGTFLLVSATNDSVPHGSRFQISAQVWYLLLVVIFLDNPG